MRRLTVALILLISLFSFTGFSTTTDLAQNSIVSIDCDIGIPSATAVDVAVEMITVEINQALEVKTAILCVPYLDWQFSEDNYPTQKQFKDNYSQDISQPPLDGVFVSRRARDGLTQVWA